MREGKVMATPTGSKRGSSADATLRLICDRTIVYRLSTHQCRGMCDTSRVWELMEEGINPGFSPLDNWQAKDGRLHRW